ncbi:MAG: hypothetical protein AAGH79_03470 [Bacteroidota bacterium]
MLQRILFTLIILGGIGAYSFLWSQSNQPYFLVELSQDTVLNGRLLVILAQSDTPEPRFQINAGPQTQLLFGQDVVGWDTRKPLAVETGAFGFPIEQWIDIPPGDYYLQVVFHHYETFNRADGHTVLLPMDRGEGQHWNRAPGNYYNTPLKINFNPERPRGTLVQLNQEIPPISPPEDTEYIKHVQIKSKMLSEFWGRDMYLGAHILLPEGWADHPEVKYPLAIMHGHFPYDFGGWRTTPPDTTEPCVYSSRFQLDCYNRIQDQEAYDFYKLWTGPDFPRVLAIKIQHANPYYDDSYAVNSENLGPYGDAIMYELIPYIEEQFRGIGEGWARFTYGGSTGGWEALAAQVFYPDEINGCFAACPDPIDFHHYVTVNLYEDKNAYYMDGAFKKVPRPERRNYLGHVDTYMQDENHLELALATNGRSGGQYDIWQAVYGPVGEDGYPKPIWDKRTGAIDAEVAEYWKENYDLTHIMRRDWATLGSKLQGKIRIYCGDMDNYYLNNAVYLAEEFLESTQPYYAGEVDYGDRAEHCWNGDHEQPNAISRLRYHRMFIPKWTEELLQNPPEGADLAGWRY